MRIWHDRSYIFANSKEMISRGYAVEDIYAVRISFVYTDEEREANREVAMTHTNEERNQENIREAKRRSDAMLPVMEAIAEAFVCDQFKEHLPYNCDAWDLFFWCNNFKSFSVGCDLQGRDYSYFTLSMNKSVSLEKRKETCERLLKLISEKFSDHPNLDVAVQYDVLFDEKRIGAEAAAVLPQLMKANCIHDGQEGRIVQGGNGVFFLRKRARKYGYRLSEMDLLRLAWSLGLNTGEAVPMSDEAPIAQMNWMMWKLYPHVGHHIVCVTYGDPDDPRDVCIECETCGCVLVSGEDYEED